MRKNKRENRCAACGLVIVFPPGVELVSAADGRCGWPLCWGRSSDSCVKEDAALMAEANHTDRDERHNR
jgi:hypothetical protein